MCVTERVLSVFLITPDLGYNLSTENLDVGGYLVGTLVQISHDTNKGPSSQEDHQPGEQQDVLERIEGFGKILCSQSDVAGDLLDDFEGIMRMTEVELYQLVGRGIAHVLNQFEGLVEAFHVEVLNILRDDVHHELYRFERVVEMSNFELGQLVCRDIARMLNRFESLVESIDVELLEILGRGLDVLKDSTNVLVVQTPKDRRNVGSRLCKSQA
jgi:hypothetical protein